MHLSSENVTLGNFSDYPLTHLLFFLYLAKLGLDRNTCKSIAVLPATVMKIDMSEAQKRTKHGQIFHCVHQ